MQMKTWFAFFPLYKDPNVGGDKHRLLRLRRS